ncbi:hypothetical protein [Streptodolium elevatio]
MVAAYLEMRQVQAQLRRTGQVDLAAIAAVSAGDARAALVADTQEQRRKGLTVTGEIRHSPRVTALVPTGEPETAAVEDCQDVSALRTTDAGGNLVQQNREWRHVATARLALVEGHWKVTEFASDPDSRC